MDEPTLENTAGIGLLNKAAWDTVDKLQCVLGFLDVIWWSAQTPGSRSLENNATDILFFL